jgi:hypothetical protein
MESGLAGFSFFALNSDKSIVTGGTSFLGSSYSITISIIIQFYRDNQM